MNEFLEQFLIECRELAEQATHDLLALEEQPGDRERLDSAFRAFHTLKGAAGIVEFTAMATALHAAEDVLSAARGGAPVTPGLIGDCLTALDQIVQWLDVMEATGEPPADADVAAQALVARFGRVAAAPTPELAPPGEPAEEDLGDAALGLLRAQLALLEDDTAERSPGRTASALRVAANVLLHAGRDEEARRLGDMLIRPARLDAAEAAAAIASLLDGSLAMDTGPTPAAREVAEPAARGLRVDIRRIDALVNLTGELIVAKNALSHAAARARDGVDVAHLLKDQHAVLDRLVSDLQDAVLNMRVLPMRQVFQRFPRLVREMVVTLGKPAHLTTEGEATEADKAIVEALFEPLLHVIRNALDHGVESAHLRAAAGKPPSATLRLWAARQGEHVVVEVADDGGGIDVEKVRAAAVARGLADPDTLASLGEDEVVELIFAPGFSTAAEVSGLSGRGVGMDAVRTAVERLGGRVELASRAGQGTTVRFVLPFTVMMSRVMTVEAAGQMFGIPLEAVVETVRVPAAAVVEIGAARALVLRDRTLPVIDLAQVLGERGGGTAALPEEVTLVVVSAGGQLGALRVERLGGRMDVMLKPMEGLLAGAFGLSGTTLLGDGRVLIVLDLQELLQLAV